MSERKVYQYRAQRRSYDYSWRVLQILQPLEHDRYGRVKTGLILPENVLEKGLKRREAIAKAALLNRMNGLPAQGAEFRHRMNKGDVA